MSSTEPERDPETGLLPDEYRVGGMVFLRPGALDALGEPLAGEPDPSIVPLPTDGDAQ